MKKYLLALIPLLVACSSLGYKSPPKNHAGVEIPAIIEEDRSRHNDKVVDRALQKTGTGTLDEVLVGEVKFPWKKDYDKDVARGQYAPILQRVNEWYPLNGNGEFSEYEWKHRVLAFRFKYNMTLLGGADVEAHIEVFTRGVLDESGKVQRLEVRTLGISRSKYVEKGEKDKWRVPVSSETCVFDREKLADMYPVELTEVERRLNQ